MVVVANGQPPGMGGGSPAEEVQKQQHREQFDVEKGLQSLTLPDTRVEPETETPAVEEVQHHHQQEEFNNIPQKTTKPVFWPPR